MSITNSFMCHMCRSVGQLSSGRMPNGQLPSGHLYDKNKPINVINTNLVVSIIFKQYNS